MAHRHGYVTLYFRETGTNRDRNSFCRGHRPRWKRRWRRWGRCWCAAVPFAKTSADDAFCWHCRRFSWYNCSPNPHLSIQLMHCRTYPSTTYSYAHFSIHNLFGKITISAFKIASKSLAMNLIFFFPFFWWSTVFCCLRSCDVCDRVIFVGCRAELLNCWISMCHNVIVDWVSSSILAPPPPPLLLLLHDYYAVEIHISPKFVIISPFVFLFCAPIVHWTDENNLIMKSTSQM